MRLYAGKVKTLSEELVRTLISGNTIETEKPSEVVKDFEAVLNGYLSAERDAGDRARQAMENRGQTTTGDYGRLKRNFAEQRGLQTGDDMMSYLLDQCIEMLLHSANVEEVFAEDHELRRTMRPIMRKYLELDNVVEAEVRGKLKHVQEGSQTWEVEYRRVMEDIQRRKGLL